MKRIITSLVCIFFLTITYAGTAWMITDKSGRTYHYVCCTCTECPYVLNENTRGTCVEDVGCIGNSQPNGDVEWEVDVNSLIFGNYSFNLVQHSDSSWAVQSFSTNRHINVNSEIGILPPGDKSVFIAELGNEVVFLVYNLLENNWKVELNVEKQLLLDNLDSVNDKDLFEFNSGLNGGDKVVFMRDGDFPQFVGTKSGH